MVFRFFKKSSETVAARPAVTPPPRSRSEATGAGERDKPGAAAPATTAGTTSQPGARGGEASSLEFEDFAFSDYSTEFQVEDEINPIDAAVEEAAILFADGQNEATRAALEKSVRLYSSGAGERLWLMLFDFYCLIGEKTPFDALEVAYVKAFEKSPPGWRDKSKPKAKSAKSPPVASGVPFKGDLAGDNRASFDAVVQSFREKGSSVCLDMTELTGVDAVGSKRLLALLRQVRKTGKEIEILGQETLLALLKQHVEDPQTCGKECWLLLLELYQLQGEHDIFEELAIEFAVNFEESPPSWEAQRVARQEKPLPPPPEKTDKSAGLNIDAYILQGIVKAARFADLNEFAEAHDPVVINCEALERMDFLSAGALFNVLATIKRSGKIILFLHPNRLVAELLGVVGMRTVAKLAFAKN